MPVAPAQLLITQSFVPQRVPAGNINVIVTHLKAPSKLSLCLIKTHFQMLKNMTIFFKYYKSPTSLKIELIFHKYIFLATSLKVSFLPLSSRQLFEIIWLPPGEDRWVWSIIHVQKQDGKERTQSRQCGWAPNQCCRGRGVIKDILKDKYFHCGSIFQHCFSFLPLFPHLSVNRIMIITHCSRPRGKKHRIRN